MPTSWRRCRQAAAEARHDHGSDWTSWPASGHLIRQVRADYEWVATLVFGAGLALVAVTLVADSMEGGTALDSVGGKADSTAIRVLTEGYLLLFGSIGCILFALLSAATGYATLATGVLPRWTGWFAYVVAVLNLAAVPSIYGGTDPTGFYTAAGWGVAVIATFPWLIWALIVSIMMLIKPEAGTPRATKEGACWQQECRHGHTKRGETRVCDA